ncbi:MAG: hypothetical protein ACHQIG_09520 [Acidimicrobiia bacterium]
MADEDVFDRDRIVECLDRFGVQYLLVGGIGAQMHGATRPTRDFDSLPSTSKENLDRLAGAMRELNARLRVEGLSDDEARTLPLPIDAESLRSMEISTWRTNAGDLDLLMAIPNRDGGRVPYEELVDRAERVQIGSVTVLVASLPDIIASKEWADRPKDREALVELRQLAARRPRSR